MIQKTLQRFGNNYRGDVMKKILAVLFIFISLQTAVHEPYNHRGSTALMHACYHLDIERVTALLATGSDVNAVDATGSTALLYTTKAYCADLASLIVRILLSYDANANSADNNGNTPLIYASFAGHLGIVKALVAAGANPNLKNTMGLTALMLSIHHERDELVHALVDAGAYVDEATPEGITALMVACAHGRYKAAHALIARSAVTTSNCHNTTPLMYAASNGHVDLVKILLKTGADASAVDQSDHTAFTYAEKQTHTAIMRLLSNHSNKKYAKKHVIE